MERTSEKDTETHKRSLENGQTPIVISSQERLLMSTRERPVVVEADGQGGYLLECIAYNQNSEKVVQRVEVVPPRFSKPYLGGFKNTSNGLDYHNAFAQTDQIAHDHKLKYHREAQTVDYDTKSTKVNRELGTQMERVGLFLDKRKDKEVVPNYYFSSEMWEQRRDAAALFIQRHLRGYSARKRTNQLKKEREEKRQEEITKEEEFRKNEEIRHKKEIERRMHPRTKDDFEILYDELELWRLNETMKIKNNMETTPEQKKAALKQLLDKESELLQTIDRLKIIANKQNREDQIQKFLKAMSDAKKWKRSDGRYTEIHTPFTTRAKELMDIYNGLSLKNISLDERLDILLNTKWTVKEFDCPPTREIVELIDREADMLNRGRPETSLDGLRKRLCNLFLQFIETPDFNPEAARFQKIPNLTFSKTQGQGSVTQKSNPGAGTMQLPSHSTKN